MKLTDKIKKGLVGKNLICQENGTTLTEGKSYKIIRTEEYKGNKLDILVVVISDYGDERSYDLMWFVDKQKDEIIYDTNKISFKQLEKSPIDGVELDWNTEEKFKKCLNENKETLICIDDMNLFTYNNLPIIATYLLEVYDYCTMLKNKVEYVDFLKAKEHMLKGNKAEFENETYYIKDDELYCEDIKSACALKLRAIESDKWILL